MKGYSLEPAEGMRQGAAPGINNNPPRRLAVSEYPTAPGAPRLKRSRAGIRSLVPDFGQHLTPNACAHIWLLTCRASQIAEKRALTRIKPRAAGSFRAARVSPQGENIMQMRTESATISQRFPCTVDSCRMTPATRRPPPDGFRHDGFRYKLSHRRPRRPIGQAAEWRIHASVGHRRSQRSSQIGAGEGTGRQLRQAAASSPCDRSLRSKLVACFGDIGVLETRGPIALDRSSNSQMGSPTPSPNLPPSENNSPKLLNQFRQPATPGSKSPQLRRIVL